MSRKKKVSRKSRSKSTLQKSNKISMDNFFNRQISLGLMKDYETKPLRVFFQKNSLSEEEDLDTYTEMLKKY